jgi:hypothetical protein
MSSDDMERLGRIDQILSAAIEQESTAEEPSTRRFKSIDVVSRALATIRGEADINDLCNLLVIDALYFRLEIMMRARGAVPDDAEREHIPRHWRHRLQ